MGIPKFAGVVIDRRRLAVEVAAHSNLNEASALSLVDVVFGEIAAALRRDGDVLVPSLGRFRVIWRGPRSVPTRTGEMRRVPGRAAVKFKPSKWLEGRVFDAEEEEGAGANHATGNSGRKDR